MVEVANNACDQLIAILGDETEPPSSLLDLKEAISGGDQGDIAQKLYLTMVQQSLDYDTIDGKLQPTNVNYSDKESPELKDKVSYIYLYGITMYKRGLLPGEWLQGVVVDQIASRVGMTGEQLDKWLNIPAV